MGRRKVPTEDSVRLNAHKAFRRVTSDSNLQRLGLGKPAYYYHYGVTRKGRVEIMGPETEIEAENFARELTDGEIFELSTRDLRQATREIKAEMLKRGGDHDLVLMKSSHQHQVPDGVREIAQGN